MTVTVRDKMSSAVVDGIQNLVKTDFDGKFMQESMLIYL